MPTTYPSRWMRGIMDPEENGPDLYPRSKSKDPGNTSGSLARYRERSYTSGIDLPPSDYDKRALLDENSIAITNSNGLQYSTRYYKSPSPQTSSPFNNTSTSLPKTRIDLSKTTNNKSNDLVYSKRYYPAPSSSPTNYTSTSHQEPRSDLPRSYDQSSDDKFTTNKKSNDLQYSPTRFSPSTSPESSSQFTSTSPQSNATKLRSRTNPASSHVHNSYSRVSESAWQELQQKPLDEQNEFLENYVKQGKFRDEEVSKSNVKRGDHIFYQGASGEIYNHHFLCTKVYKNSIEIIEYGSRNFGVSASSRSVVSSNPMGLGAITKRILTFQDLMKEKAKVRKWPKELKRYPVHEVISRAKSRKNEREYHPLYNNCECFVMWCKIGLNISLQVTSLLKVGWESVVAGAGGLVESAKNQGVNKATPYILKAVGNLGDEMATIPGISPAVGFAIGAVIETGFACYYINKDWQKKEKGIISERQFKVNAIDTSAKAAGHVTGGTVGSLIGLLAFGPVGSVIGGGIGYFAGHFAGEKIGKLFSSRYDKE